MKKSIKWLTILRLLSDVSLVGVISGSQNKKVYAQKELLDRIQHTLLPNTKKFFAEKGYLMPYILSLQNHQ